MKKVLLLSLFVFMLFSFAYPSQVYSQSSEMIKKAHPPPDLFISEFTLNPSTPTQRNRVDVRVGVYNKGSARSGDFTVEWWPGENFTEPGCTWRVNGLAARGGRILTCGYSYRSWYGKLVTKTTADSKGEVRELNEKNNARRMEITVRKLQNTAAKPDLFISEFTLNPSTPTQRNRVDVRVGVYNKGGARSGNFTVEWWPGENFTEPGCTWRVNGLAARGGRILTCNYSYRSWYGKLVTKTTADSNREVLEINEKNNARRMKISVRSL